MRTEGWGSLTERRVVLRSGLEVETGFVAPIWASVDPVDPGTGRVVGEGLSPLVDPKGVVGACPPRRRGGGRLTPGS